MYRNLNQCRFEGVRFTNIPTSKDLINYQIPIRRLTKLQLQNLAILNYSLYKKKRKHYIIFNNLRTFNDEHFKLTGDLDWHVPYQLDEFHNFPAL